MLLHQLISYCETVCMPLPNKRLATTSVWELWKQCVLVTNMNKSIISDVMSYSFSYANRLSDTSTLLIVCSEF